MQAFGVAVIGGVMLGIGFLLPPLWWLSVPGFAVVLIGIAVSASERHAAAVGFISACVLYGLSLYPVFWHTMPLTWLGLDEVWFQYGVLFLTWGTTVLTLAFPCAFFGALVKRYGAGTWHDLLLVPSLWVLAEWCGAWLYSVVNMGPGSLHGSHFTIGSPAYLLAADPLILQSAFFGGVYALTAVLAFLGTLLASIYVHSRSRFAAAIVCVFLFAAIPIPWKHTLLPSAERTADSAISVAAVSTQEPARFVPEDHEESVQFAAISELLANAGPADAVLLPEGSGFLARVQVSGGTDFLAALGVTGTLIDSRTVRLRDGSLRGRIEYVDGSSRQTAYSDKQFLLPFGEYVPSLYRPFIIAAGEGERLRALERARGYRAGVATPIEMADGTVIAARACSEVISPHLYRENVQEGAAVLFNLASHSWFHDSKQMYAIALNMSRVRATETRRWLVEAGNVVPSFAIDPYGTIAQASAWGSVGVMHVDVYPRSDITPYVRFGELVLLIPLLSIAVILGKRRWQGTDHTV